MMKCFTHGARTWEMKGRGSGRAGERGPSSGRQQEGYGQLGEHGPWGSTHGALPSAQTLCTPRCWLPYTAAMGRQGDGRAGRQAEELPTGLSLLPQIIILFSQGFHVFLLLALCLWPPNEETGWRLRVSAQLNQEWDPGFLLWPPHT